MASSSASSARPTAATPKTTAAAEASVLNIPEPRNREEAMLIFNRIRTEARRVAQKVAELEGEKHDHSLVIGTIEKMEPSRKCFRMVGGVLVERTVGEVLPAVQRNRDGLHDAVTNLTAQLNRVELEVIAFAKKHDIKLGGGGEPAAAPATQQKDDNASAGVLV
eukprot:gnl/Spiro4/27586_TR13724_c0_g1_i1.p1 gnl/Spiro4/27586_TR13724_c0_g1~~gnl/Spiro4/27586_TR13724_c0_g1_i1.p1  ORF type:complete len:188 (+),score=57.52 gnl/Spiro4/27586_TR13724_c0_g1_i1:74-565(+)